MPEIMSMSDIENLSEYEVARRLLHGRFSNDKDATDPGLASYSQRCPSLPECAEDVPELVDAVSNDAHGFL